MNQKYDTNSLIKKFMEVHGDEYDYSKTVYNEYKEKVTVTCKEHGDFKIGIGKHLSGQGCPVCRYVKASKTNRRSIDEVISEMKKVHNDKYDYSKVNYVNNKTKVCIICPEHGEFWQTPNNHLRGQGCPKCRNKEFSLNRCSNYENFIEKARKVHGDKYDYSKVEYVNNHTKVCIICPEHGEFWQMPNNHTQGQGCPECSKSKRIKEKPKKEKVNKTELFIEKARKIHGDKYDYSKVEYVDAKTKVCIICPEHGEFWQTPNKHLCGQGCYKCGMERISIKQKLTLDEFINRSNKKHNNKYDYSKVEYINNQTKVCIICPEHGEFWQEPNSHMNGCGCPSCAKRIRQEKRKWTTGEFIDKAVNKYGDKYDYSKVEYINNTTPVTITCHKKYKNGIEHGDFKVSPNKFLGRGTQCPKCSLLTSKPEIELYDYVCSLVGKDNVIRNCRSVLDDYEIDIYVKNKNFGIEFNGLFWHSDAIDHIYPRYHITKTKECENHGITLVHIFSDEYFQHNEIVKEKIKHLLGCDCNKERIMARKCVVKEIDWKTSKNFINKYHIQGQTRASVYLGCYYKDILIGVMSFLKEKCGFYELNRFATDYNYICCGVGGKLFNYFIRNYKPIEVKSFADRRWTTDINTNLYTLIGFKLVKTIPPDYKYINKNKPSGRLHKFNFRKQVLHKKYGFPLTMTENEMTKELGYYKVYDCGLLKYVWKCTPENK